MDKFYAVQIGQLIFGVPLVVVIIAVITGEGHGAAHGDVGENKRAGAHGIVPIALLIRSQFIPLGAGDVDHRGHKGIQGYLGSGVEVENHGEVSIRLYGLHHVQLGGPVHLALHRLIPAGSQAQDTVVGVLHVRGHQLPAAEDIVLGVFLALEVDVLPEVDGQG